MSDLLCWPKWFTEYDIGIHVAEMKTTNLKSPEVEMNKVWKTQQAMVYSVDLSGLLSRTLAYM